MQNHDIYALTPEGKKELSGGSTTLSVDEIKVLVRIDASRTFAQIKASVPHLATEAFTATFKKLLTQRLLTLAEIDPFGDQFQNQLRGLSQFSPLECSQAEAEADSGAASLKKTGYFVRIARKRGTLSAP